MSTLLLLLFLHSHNTLNIHRVCLSLPLHVSVCVFVHYACNLCCNIAPLLFLFAVSLSLLCSTHDKKNKGEIMHALLSLFLFFLSLWLPFTFSLSLLCFFPLRSPLLLHLPSITACVRGLKAQCVSHSALLSLLSCPLPLCFLCSIDNNCPSLSLSLSPIHSFIHSLSYSCCMSLFTHCYPPKSIDTQTQRTVEHCHCCSCKNNTRRESERNITQVHSSIFQILLLVITRICSWKSLFFLFLPLSLSPSVSPVMPPAQWKALKDIYTETHTWTLRYWRKTFAKSLHTYVHKVTLFKCNTIVHLTLLWMSKERERERDVTTVHSISLWWQLNFFFLLVSTVCCISCLEEGALSLSASLINLAQQSDKKKTHASFYTKKYNVTKNCLSFAMCLNFKVSFFSLHYFVCDFLSYNSKKHTISNALLFFSLSPLLSSPPSAVSHPVITFTVPINSAKVCVTSTHSPSAYFTLCEWVAAINFNSRHKEVPFNGHIFTLSSNWKCFLIFFAPSSTPCIGTPVQRGHFFFFFFSFSGTVSSLWPRWWRWNTHTVTQHWTVML